MYVVCKNDPVTPAILESNLRVLEKMRLFRSDVCRITVKYADDLVRMAKEETVLKGMIDKLIEIGRCYGMEMNVEKTKVIRISRQPSLVTIMIDQNQLEDVEYFKYLGSMLTNDGRYTCQIKIFHILQLILVYHNCY